MKTLRVLVVDDDEDVAASLAEYLELDGCDVDVQTTGAGGRRMALAGRAWARSDSAGIAPRIPRRATVGTWRSHA